MRALAAIVAGGCLTLALPGRSWALDRAAYEEARQQVEYVANPEPTATEPGGALADRIVELRGKVAGLLSAGDGQVTILLAYGERSLLITATPQERGLVTNARVRLLARIPRAFSGLLELVAITPDFDDPPSPSPAAVQVEKTVPTPQHAEPPVRGHTLASRSGDLILPYRRAVQYFNPRLTSAQSDAIARALLGFSAYYGVDPRLVVAMIAVESGFNPSATSPKGAMGLGQLMPGTAAGLGVRNPYDIYENLAGSIRLIRGHLERNAGDPQQLALALASYNAGSGAVRKYGGIPPYRETRNYVTKVQVLYHNLLTPEERKALQQAQNPGRR